MPEPKPAVPFISLPHILEHHAKRTPDAPAILAPGRSPLTYSRLYQHIDKVGNTLRAMGLGRHDRVVVILPNGPDLAVAVLAVAASATCAPLNPAYGPEELDRYFADLRPRALITQADSPARRVALSRGVQVVELSSVGAEAGLFTLTSDRGSAPPRETVGPSDVALLMLTSGTTSRPKIVPLTHANICTSACSWGPTLALTETDRCLNMMPLFLGHGLIATVMASLAAGASVICTPGYDMKSFLGWLTAFRPTWYSAVPTIHQAILAEARRHRERAADHRLRFVRSGAARMPPHVFAELERTFATCVIEFCGITETAASPVACNPLPPRPRKVGSIGLPVELDVAIMDEGGALLPGGQTGQVVVRGTSVTSGYDGDPVATRDAFADGWFKTGDQGFFDDDGYLFLVGRTKEIINRGGQKVAPTEVDAVLLEHPSVAEAATFAVPHPTLGEDVAAAIVLRPDAVVTPKDIRQFAMGRIAAFKAPRHVLIVAEIPKGPTGKVQRVGLAAKLGLVTNTALRQPYIAPRTPLEKILAGIFAEVLQVEQVGLHDNFFALGGDSLLATRVVIRLYEITHIEIEVSFIFEAPTVAELAERIETLIQAAAASQAPSGISRVPRQNGIASASFGQERLRELQHVLPDLPFFNILYALRVTSLCDVAVLEQSINEIVRRHEILRTTFAAVDGRCMQVIAPQLFVPLAFDDLRTLPRLQMETAVRGLIQEELAHSFALERGPLIRTRLVRLAERTHLLLIAAPGIIEDGWSLGVLVNELTALYDAFAAGRASPLPPLPIQYADFAEWQRRWRSYPDIVAQLTYWEEQLRDPLPVMMLTTARRRQEIDNFYTARQPIALPSELTEAVKDFSQREGVTLFMTLLAALKTLLHRYTGEDDLRVATDIANRHRPRTEGLIGPISNTVILRTSLRGDPSAREVIRRVRATTLGALANQDIPFEAVVEALEHNRAIEPAALAQVKMTLQSDSLRPVISSGLGLDFEEVDPGMMQPLVTITAFDIVLMFRESTRGLVGTCVYKPQLFDFEDIDRLLRDLQQVLEHVITQPERPISMIEVSPN
jgi:acyl-CoA synthetase (AMP-forming)/AMP-acid ligase II/acyl carrier protein